RSRPLDDLGARPAGDPDGRHQPGREGDRAADDLQSAVASDRPTALPSRQVGGTHGVAVDGRRGARRRPVHRARGAGRGWRIVARDPGGGPGGARAGGAHGGRGAVLRALDAGAVGALHARLLLRGAMELRPARVRSAVPAAARFAVARCGGSGAQPADLQHAVAGRGGGADVGVPPPARGWLRAARVGMRARARVGGVRVAGLQVSAMAPPPHARRMAVAWAMALVLGAAAVGVAQTAWTRLPRPHPLEELSYYPS